MSVVRDSYVYVQQADMYSNLDLRPPFRLISSQILFTDLKYVHAKLDPAPENGIAQAGCHESLSWIKDTGVEIISQGVKQGSPMKYGVPQKSKGR